MDFQVKTGLLLKSDGVILGFLAGLPVFQVVLWRPMLADVVTRCFRLMRCTAGIWAGSETKICALPFAPAAL